MILINNKIVQQGNYSFNKYLEKEKDMIEFKIKSSS